MNKEEKRRFHGEFFTPIRFARKALEYIEKIIGKEWWKSGEYRIWDMASGTGNLECGLPNESYQYLYLSTLYQSEVEYCKKIFPKATVFQYDYLNDDIGNSFTNRAIDNKLTWKLPKKLQDDLSNPKLKWLILINPPFATSQTAGTSGRSKQNVSNTEVRKIMHEQKLGEVSRELFSQFIFRIKKEFENKTAYFALFSPIKYINANNNQKFRDNIFQFIFEQGFIFSSDNFSGTSKNTPFIVGFLIWNLNKTKHLEKQIIELDIFNNNVEKIGVKRIKSENRNLFLNKWLKRPPTTNKFPPLASAIKLKTNNKDKRDRISDNFLASFMCKGNNFQNKMFTAFLSAPYVSAGALSVTPDNFEKAMFVYAVRTIPKATWLNRNDQFLQPKKELSTEFINDCTVWNIFSNSNQTAAMKDIEYENNIYQIQNHFFPFLLSEIKNWQITESDFKIELASAKDRFMAEWLSKAKLSKEAKEVLDTGKEIYKFYFNNLNKLRTDLFKIKTWDAGYWQIRKALHEQNLCNDLFQNLKEKHNILKNKILPQIEEILKLRN